jgi:hypothetical protein
MLQIFQTFFLGILCGLILGVSPETDLQYLSKNNSFRLDKLPAVCCIVRLMMGLPSVGLPVKPAGFTNSKRSTASYTGVGVHAFGDLLL